MMRILSVLSCGALIGLALWGLSNFARYCGRRAALAEAPHEFFTRAAEQWFLIMLIVSIGGILACVVACIWVLQAIGGLVP